MKIRRIALPLLAALLLAPLAACSSGSSSDSAPDPAISVGEAGGDMFSNEAADGSAGASMTDPVDTERSIIQQGSLDLTVDSTGSAAEKVTEVVKSLGGRIESQNLDSTSGSGDVQASLQLRVPSDRLDDAFTELAKLGEVRSQSRSATDVTAEHVDLQARVKALDASVERLTELMSGAETTSELIEAESALAQRQQELDGLRAQLKSLEGLVDESSISVSLSSKSALPGGGPANFWEGLVTGWGSIVASGSGALVLLGVLLPWLVLGGAVALIIVWIVRSSRRAKRKRSLAPNTPATPENQPVSPATPEQ